MAGHESVLSFMLKKAVYSVLRSLCPLKGRSATAIPHKERNR